MSRSSDERFLRGEGTESRAAVEPIAALVAVLAVGAALGLYVGALDDAATTFSAAADAGTSPRDFVSEMKAKNKLIMGIGHKIKSLEDPDVRVSIVKDFVATHFAPAFPTPVFDFALAVERVTTQKKSNLILNVDGAVAAAFVDLARGCGAFTENEAEEVVRLGTLNALFVLARSIGFIGHHLDQKRLGESLYRVAEDEVTYLVGAGL